MKTINYIDEINKAASVHEVNVWVRNALTASHQDFDVKRQIDLICKVAEAKASEIIKSKHGKKSTAQS